MLGRNPAASPKQTRAVTPNSGWQVHVCCKDTRGSYLHTLWQIRLETQQKDCIFQLVNSTLTGSDKRQTRGYKYTLWRTNCTNQIYGGSKLWSHRLWSPCCINKSSSFSQNRLSCVVHALQVSCFDITWGWEKITQHHSFPSCPIFI